MAVRLKRPDEVKGIAAAGRVLADVLDDLAAALVPGITAARLDEIARDRILAEGGVPSFQGYRGFPGAICASTNDLVVHGIPGPVALVEGDIVSLDVGVTLHGWVADAARTLAVGSPSVADAHLLETTDAALSDAVGACRVGGTIGDIGAAVQARAQAGGLGVFPSLIGHGVGHALHEDPQVPNVGLVGAGPVLEPGLVIAVEPMLTLGRPAVRLAADRWSVFTVDGARAAHAEVTVALEEAGPRVLTPWGGRW